MFEGEWSAPDRIRLFLNSGVIGGAPLGRRLVLDSASSCPQASTPSLALAPHRSKPLKSLFTSLCHALGPAIEYFGPASVRRQIWPQDFFVGVAPVGLGM